MSGRFARFLAAGGVAALANLASRAAFSRVMPLEPAVVLAYLVGMATAFVLMRRYVFEPSTRPVPRQAGSFVVVNLLALAQTFVVTVALARWGLPALGVSAHVEDLAHAAGVATPIVTSYLGHRHWTFRP